MSSMNAETTRWLQPISFCHNCGWRDPDDHYGVQAARAHAATLRHVVSVVESRELLITPHLAEATA